MSRRRRPIEVERAKRFGIALRTSRTQLRETVEQVVSGELFARILNIPPSTYYALEKGQGEPLSAAQFQILVEGIEEIDFRVAESLRTAHQEIYRTDFLSESMFDALISARKTTKQQLIGGFIENTYSDAVRKFESGDLKTAHHLVRKTRMTVERFTKTHPELAKLALLDARFTSSRGAHFEAVSMLANWLDNNPDADQGSICEIMLSQASCSNRMRLYSGPLAAKSFMRISKYISDHGNDDLKQKDSTWNWVQNNCSRSTLLAITDSLEMVDHSQITSLYNQFMYLTRCELREYGASVNKLVEARYFAFTGDLDKAWQCFHHQSSLGANLPDMPLRAKTEIILNIKERKFEQSVVLAEHWAKHLNLGGNYYGASQFYVLRNYAESLL